MGINSGDPAKAHDYFATGVTMISVAANGRSNVMAATRAIGLSANPPLVGVCFPSWFNTP